MLPHYSWLAICADEPGTSRTIWVLQFGRWNRASLNKFGGYMGHGVTFLWHSCFSCCVMSQANPNRALGRGAGPAVVTCGAAPAGRREVWPGVKGWDLWHSRTPWSFPGVQMTWHDRGDKNTKPRISQSQVKCFLLCKDSQQWIYNSDRVLGISMKFIELSWGEISSICLNLFKFRLKQCSLIFFPHI